MQARKKRLQRYEFFLTFANNSAIIFKNAQRSCQTIVAGWSFSRILMYIVLPFSACAVVT